MARPSCDENDARSTLGAPGWVFVLGTVLPSLWAFWVLLRLGVANSSLWGQQTNNSTYPRDMAELWATAVLLTLTTLALLVMFVRSTERRRSTAILGCLSFAAAVANWAILLLP
jgi:hypothetical protein